MSSSQKQAVITLIEKKDRDKRYIKNWIPISLLNVDAKILSKVLTTRMKRVIYILIGNEQSAYVPGRHITDTFISVSDLLYYVDQNNLDGYLVSVDMEKAFDSVDHTFIVSTLRKYGFGPNFIQWIKVLLNKQVSCVMNNGFTTGYFTNGHGTRQGDPISAYLFISVLEILFLQVKEKEKIGGIKISSHEFSLSAFADDATYLVCNMDSIEELFRLQNEFEQFSSQKTNQEKTIICGIGSLKGVNGAFCGCKSVNVLNNTITILGVAHSYNSDAAQYQNFVNLLDKTQSILNIWNMRSLSLLRRVQIFKTFAISKLNYLASVSNIPKDVVNQLTIMQKQIYFKNLYGIMRT